MIGIRPVASLSSSCMHPLCWNIVLTAVQQDATIWRHELDDPITLQALRGLSRLR